MHTLPLPEVTDDRQNTKIANGSSNLGSAQIAPRASNFGLRVSAHSPQQSNLENGNSNLGSAQVAPRAPNFGLRVSANSPRSATSENGNSNQTGPRNSGLGVRDAKAETPNPGSPAAGLSHLSSQQLQFLLRVTPSALASQREYEVPACVTVAQAILESATPKFGWGSSVLFRVANNPFGIKYSHFFTAASSSVVEKVEKVKEVEKSEAGKPLTLSTSSTSSTVGQVEAVEKAKEVGASSPSTSSTFSTSSTSAKATAPSMLRPGKLRTGRRKRSSPSFSVSPI